MTRHKQLTEPAAKTLTSLQRNKFSVPNFYNICMLLSIIFLTPILGRAEKENNLLKNCDLNVNDKGQLLDWRIDSPYMQDKGHKGLNSVRMILGKKARTCFQLTMVQDVKNLKPGKYVFTANVKSDKAIDELLLCKIVKSKQGDPYQTTKIKGNGLPEPGTWGVVKAEFDISEQYNSATIAFDIRNSVPGVTLWVDSPALRPQVENTLSMSIYPPRLQRNTYNICESFPGILQIDFSGKQANLKGKTITVELDLPNPIEYLISCGFLPSNRSPILENDKAIFTPDKFTYSRIERNKKAYNHYVITIDPAICSRIYEQKPTAYRFDRFYVKAPKGSSGFCGNVFWKLKLGDDVCEEGSFKINVLPPLVLPEKKCSRFMLSVIYPFSLTVPMNEISDAYTNYWKSFYDRPLMCYMQFLSNYPDELLKKITDNFELAYMEDACLKAGNAEFLYKSSFIQISERYKLLQKAANNPEQYIPLLRNPAMPPLIDNNGEIIKQWATGPAKVEPWYLAIDPESLVWGKEFSAFADLIKKCPIPIKVLILDLEPGNGFDTGFSMENREYFKKFAHLDHIPSPEEINKRYPAEWFLFRASQHAQIIRNFASAIHRYLPGMKFYVTAHPANPKLYEQKAFAYDVKDSDDIVDVHMDMYYNSGINYFRSLEAARILQIKKPIFPLIDPAENIEAFYYIYSPLKVKQNIIAAAALGCMGIGFWPGDSLDGRYLVKIAEAFSMLPEAEKFYSNPPLAPEYFKWEPVNELTQEVKNDDGSTSVVQLLKLKDKTKVLSHKKSDEYLVTLLNYDNTNTVFFKLSIPSVSAGFYSVKELGTNLFYSENARNLNADILNQGFLVEVPSNDVKVIKISTTTNDIPVGPSISQAELQEKSKLALENIKVKDDIFKTKQDGNMRIEWKAKNNNAGAMPFLQITGKERALSFDPGVGTELTGWVNNENNEDDLLSQKGNRGFMGRIMLNDSSQSKPPYDFTLDKTFFSDNMANVVFKYKVPPYEGVDPTPNPLEGLEITRTMSLSSDGLECKMKFEFFNDNALKNNIKFGFKINNYLRVGSSIAGNKTVSEIAEIAFDSPNSTSKTVKRLALETKADEMLYRGKNWNGGDVLVTAQEAGKTAQLRLIPDKKAEILYIWHSPKDFTVEFIASDLKLSYGEKDSFEIKAIIEK